MHWYELKKLKYRIFIAMPVCFISQLMNAQVTLRGSVNDVDGPLVGVNVVVEDTTVGTTSDFDGNFQLDVPSLSQTLVFSYVGYQTIRIEVTSETTLTVEMIPDAQYLDEIVVVGYGTQLKSNLVGSVVSVDVEEANQIPVTYR